jgi:NAD-dependent dihydropyrimidine dehydrogenase PreA subunit
MWKVLKAEVFRLCGGAGSVPRVKVDWSKCNGDGVCVEVCPVNVFELKKLPEYSDEQRSVPVREGDCIACMACVASCPTQAITVED